MAVDVATLAAKFDTSDLKRGSKDLDTVTQKGAQAEASINGVEQSAKKAGKATKGMTGGVRNLGMQLNQIAQVGGMTGNWMQAIAVQLPDILLGFGTFGIAAGVAAGALIPFISGMSSTGDSAKALQDRFDSLSEAIRAYNDAVNLSRDYTRSMAENFKTVNPTLIQTYNTLANIEKLKMYEQFQQTSASLSQLVTDLKWYDDRSKQSAAQDFLGLGGISMKARQAGADFLAILQTLKTTTDQAERLRAAIQIRDTLDNATGGWKNMNDEQRTLYEGVVKLIRDISVVEDGANGVTTALGGAAGQASILSSNLQDAASAL